MKKISLIVLTSALLLSCASVGKFFNALGGATGYNHDLKMQEKLAKKYTVTGFMNTQPPLLAYDRIGECYVKYDSLTSSDEEALKVPETTPYYCVIHSFITNTDVTDYNSRVLCSNNRSTGVELAEIMAKAIKAGQCENKAQ